MILTTLLPSLIYTTTGLVPTFTTSLTGGVTTGSESCGIATLNS